jgi:serine phosphatase RsbU (regulator of sigma subunit)
MTSDRTRLLVVDDENLNRELLVRALEKAGYEARGCRNGHEALELLEQEGPVLMVLDYEMPELTGAQVCEIVRKHPDPTIATVPIILLTAHSGEQHEIECLRAGADDFVTKPINATILKARIDTQVRLHTLRAQLQEQNAELERSRAIHQADLEAARLTQQAILPARPPAIPGWDIAAHFQPLIQVGGDIYDWLRLPNGDWLIWIADATGHGASAALVTTLTKLVFRHAAAEASTPCEVMDAVNAEFFAVFKGRSYITAACLVLHPESGKIAFAGAGHPPLLIARASGENDALPSQAPPIGIRPDLACEEMTSEAATGDTLLLYTDGLYSMTDRHGARLAPDDIRQFFPAAAKSASDFLAGTVTAAHELAAPNAFPDDLAAIALRRT